MPPSPLEVGNVRRRLSGTAADALGNDTAADLMEIGGGVSSSHRHIASEEHTSHFPFDASGREVLGGGVGSLIILHRHSAGVLQNPQSD